MDHFVLGKRRVNCEIIEADVEGIPPDEDDFDENSPSLLDVIVEQNDKVRIHSASQLYPFQLHVVYTLL